MAGLSPSHSLVMPKIHDNVRNFETQGVPWTSFRRALISKASLDKQKSSRKKLARNERVKFRNARKCYLFSYALQVRLRTKFQELNWISHVSETRARRIAPYISARNVFGTWEDRRCHLLRKVLEIKLAEINNLARQSTSAATSKLLLIKTSKSTDQTTVWSKNASPKKYE